MIKSSIEKIAEDIGFDIGNSDDVTQTNLLNGFCRALKNSMQPHQLEVQICYIVEKLSPDSLAVMSKIFEFIELKQSK